MCGPCATRCNALVRSSYLNQNYYNQIRNCVFDQCPVMPNHHFLISLFRRSKDKKEWQPMFNAPVYTVFQQQTSTGPAVLVFGDPKQIEVQLNRDVALNSHTNRFCKLSDKKNNVCLGLGFSSSADKTLFSEMMRCHCSQGMEVPDEKSLAGSPEEPAPIMTRRFALDSTDPSQRYNNSSNLDCSPNLTQKFMNGTYSSPRSGDRPVIGSAVNSPSRKTDKDASDHKSSRDNDTLLHSQTMEDTDFDPGTLLLLKHENAKMKRILASSCANLKKWEQSNLVHKNNIARLMVVLSESCDHVEMWRNQLNIVKEENKRLNDQLKQSEHRVIRDFYGVDRDNPSGRYTTETDINKLRSLAEERDQLAAEVDRLRMENAILSASSTAKKEEDARNLAQAGDCSRVRFHHLAV